MIKLFSLKQQKAQDEKDGTPKQKTSAAQLRVTKDISDGYTQFCHLFWKILESFRKSLSRTIHVFLSNSEKFAKNKKLAMFCIPVCADLSLPSTCKTEFENPDDLLNFKLYLCPDEGYYKGGKFIFSFKVGNNYPHEPPKVSYLLFYIR